MAQVGFPAVANFVPYTISAVDGVAAGFSVGGAGMASRPTAAVVGALLMEAGTYILLEDGGKILLE